MKRFIKILILSVILVLLFIIPSFADTINPSVKLSVTSGYTYNYGEGTITLNCNVSGESGTATGNIDFYLAGKKDVKLGSNSLSDGSCELTLDIKGSKWIGGTVVLKAKYSGDENYSEASSNNEIITVNPKTLTIKVENTNLTYTGAKIIPEYVVEGFLEEDKDLDIVKLSFKNDKFFDVKEIKDAGSYTVTFTSTDSRYVIPFSESNISFTVERGPVPYISIKINDEVNKNDGATPIYFNYGEENIFDVIFPSGAGMFNLKVVENNAEESIATNVNPANTLNIKVKENAGEYNYVFSFKEGSGYLEGDFTLKVIVNKKPIDVNIYKLDKKGCGATIYGDVIPDISPIVEYFDNNGNKYSKVPTKKGTYIAKVTGFSGEEGLNYEPSSTSNIEMEYVVNSIDIKVIIAMVAVVLIIIFLIVYFLKIKKGKK